MPTAFHVDRHGRLAPGLELGLASPAPIRPDGTLDLAAMAHLDQAFPGGLTRFGREYLIERLFLTGTDDTGQETDLIFELVRRLDFPDRPSRYTSIFASATVPEATGFREGHCGGQGTIWEVESGDEWFRADHELLDLSETPLDVWMRARRYWRGEASDAPRWELLLRPPVRAIRPVVPPAV